MLLALVAGIAASPSRREKRTFSWIFPEEEPKKNLPIYKVHRYSGIHLEPIGPNHPPHNPHQGVPEIGGEPPDVLEVTDDDGDSYGSDGLGGGLGSLVSLIPLTTDLLPGVLSLSGGSSGGGNDYKAAESRIGHAAKANFLKSIKDGKVAFVSSVASGAFNGAVRKGTKTVTAVKNVLTGNANVGGFTTGIYRFVPSHYPKHQGLLSKIPVIGKWFGHGTPIDVPNVYLPYIPELASVPDAPNLPHINLPVGYEFPAKTGAYVKIKVPKVGKYEIPSTSYGEPELSVPVPGPDVSDEENEVNGQLSPEPETKPYPPEKPDYVPPPPAELPEKPAAPFNPGPYPPEQKFPYPPEVPSKVPDYPYPPEVPTVAEYVPPPPELPEPPKPAVVQPYPPAQPSQPSQQQTYPYPAAQVPQQVYPYPAGNQNFQTSYTYPPAGVAYLPNYYQSSGSENHVIYLKPEDILPIAKTRPVYVRRRVVSNGRRRIAETKPDTNEELVQKSAPVQSEEDKEEAQLVERTLSKPDPVPEIKESPVVEKTTENLEHTLQEETAEKKELTTEYLVEVVEYSPAVEEAKGE